MVTRNRNRRRQQARPQQVQQPLPLVRIICTGPVGMEDDVVEVLKQVYERTGQKCTLHIDEGFVGDQGVQVTGTTTRPGITANGDQAPQVQQSGQGSRRRASMNQQAVRTVYAVAQRQADPGGPTRQRVFQYFMRHPYTSKRDCMNSTGLGLKQVESAIHAMTVDGILGRAEAGTASLTH